MSLPKEQAKNLIEALNKMEPVPREPKAKRRKLPWANEEPFEQYLWRKCWGEMTETVFSELENNDPTEEVDTHWEAKLRMQEIRERPTPKPVRKTVSLGEKLEQNARRAKYFGTVSNVPAAEWERWCDAFGRRCAYCGLQLKTPVLEHVVPLSRGGSDTMDNVVPSCMVCNRRKGTRTPYEWLRSEGKQDEFTQRVMAALEVYRCAK